MVNITNKKIDWTNPEEIKEYKAEWQLQNKERLSIKSKKWRKKNKERIKIRTKKWGEDNKYNKKKSDKDYKSRPEIKKKISAMERKRYNKKKKNICMVCGDRANLKYCSKKCMGTGMDGENHHNWQGGKSFEPYDKNWNNLFKKQVRERDGNMCMVCNHHRDEFKRALDVHHIDGDKINTIEKNCITLCQRHHMIIERSGDRKYTFWMPKFQDMLSNLYGYKYMEEIN